MSFERPDLSRIDARIRADIEATMTEVPIVRRGSVLAALSRGLAGASHALHGHLDWIYRQLFPDTADAAQLERQAGFYGLTRAAPAAATGAALLTGAEGATAPEGAALGDASGLELTITEATLVVDGVALAPIAAVETGAAGNLAAGARLALLSPVAGIETDGEVAEPGLSGGAETESDARLLERLLLRLRRPPHGGAAHDYVAWALETPGVTRVWLTEEEMGLGTITVRFAVDRAAHGPAPTAGEVAAVQSYIDARRPVAAHVFVAAPVLAPTPITLRLTPDTLATRAAAEAALADLFRREGAPGTLIRLSHIREALSLAPGETDHELTQPLADLSPGVGVMPVLGPITFLVGGS